jgi:hypothetical protein
MIKLNLYKKKYKLLINPKNKLKLKSTNSSAIKTNLNLNGEPLMKICREQITESMKFMTILIKLNKHSAILSPKQKSMKSKPLSHLMDHTSEDFNQTYDFPHGHCAIDAFSWDTESNSVIITLQSNVFDAKRLVMPQRNAKHLLRKSIG